MTQLEAAGADETANWVDSRLRQGRIVKVAGAGDGSAVGIMPLEGAFHRITLYDRRTGDKVSVPRHDREYQLAKMRPTNPSVKGSQYKREWIAGRLVADVDMEPVYSETPPAVTGPATRVAPDRGPKRSRRRGKRGRGGRQ
jgi:hypothetical protein